ncbi:sialic acid-binding Ig-like lectin 13 [Mixophyes fleayi]|uniref:sialic acid-binding Ig-like lectin 13 n=1 Tax=Mixophyes fleayi TaxID=3061075 RepID=UPI003F4E3A39
MWVYHVIIILSLLWKDTCQQTNQYSIQKNDRVIVEEGMCVTIDCTFIADSKTTFKKSRGYWKIYGSNKIVASNIEGIDVEKQNFNMTGDPNTGDCTLTITNIRKEDSHHYYFRFEDGENQNVKWNYWSTTYVLVTVKFPTVMNSTQKSIDLNIHYPPSVIITGEINGRRIQQTESLEVLEGLSLRLSCSVDSNPVSKVTWMKGEDNVLNSAIGQVLELGLSHITASNTDTYYCLAQNEFGRMSRSLAITVQYPPRKPDVIILPSQGKTLEARRPINEDESLTLNCTVDGEPAAVVSWIKEDIDVDSNNMIVQGLMWSLVNITPSEADVYRCLAWNKHGFHEKRIQFNSIPAVQNMLEKCSNMDPQLTVGIVAAKIVTLSLVSLGLFYFHTMQIKKRQLGNGHNELERTEPIYQNRRRQKNNIYGNIHTLISTETHIF